MWISELESLTQDLEVTWCHHPPRGVAAGVTVWGHNPWAVGHWWNRSSVWWGLPPGIKSDRWQHVSKKAFTETKQKKKAYKLMEKQQSQCRTALIKARDNLQSGTRQERDETSQRSSLAQIFIKPQFNAGWGFVGRNVVLSGVCRRHSHSSGQPLAPTSHASVITVWASSLN